MKVKVLLTSGIMCFIFGITSAQTTITLQPDSAAGKDAYIHDLDTNENLGNHPDFDAIAWTCGGPSCIARCLINFDLSGIPTGSSIISADLSLFHNPTSGNPGHSTQSGSNASVLQRITSSWDEFGVTWNNQPTTDTLNEVILPESASDVQDYPNIDVTAIVQDIYDNPTTSFGFMMKLQTEDYFRSLIFASSDHADSSLHPKLTVTYAPLVGIFDSEDKADILKISPNPFSSYTVLTTPNYEVNNGIYTLYNSLGQVVRKEYVGNAKTVRINKSELLPGMYLLVLTEEGRLIGRKKLVVR